MRPGTFKMAIKEIIDNLNFTKLKKILIKRQY